MTREHAGGGGQCTAEGKALQDKSRWLAADGNGHEEAMPDGTGDLAELPRRRVDAPIGDEAADDEFWNS